LDALAYVPYIWTIPTYDSPSPNYRDPVRAMIGEDDEENVVEESGRGRNALTGY